jgi:hypothetical protein
LGIAGTIGNQPKSITRQYKLLLFPEHDAREYYRIVFWKAIILDDDIFNSYLAFYVEGKRQFYN